MIIAEFVNEEKTLIKHYSDKNVLLIQEQTGLMFPEPVDLYPCLFRYIESDIPIETEEENGDATEADYQEALREVGADI